MASYLVLSLAGAPAAIGALSWYAWRNGAWNAGQDAAYHSWSQLGQSSKGLRPVHAGAWPPMRTTRNHGDLRSIGLKARIELSPATLNLGSVPTDSFGGMMAANVRLRLLRMVQLSPLLRDSASVVPTSSKAANAATPVPSSYAATKGAIISFVRCWAAALAERKTLVNILAPGPIAASCRNFMAGDLRTEFQAAVVSPMPLGWVAPADASRLAVDRGSTRR